MIAKLIKDHDNYHLVNDKQFVIGTTDKGILSCTDKMKLSLKNCQAIENGYDLMKLAEENSHKYYDVKTTDWHCNYNGFFSGFQKALSILGDKKFSEEDMISAFKFGWERRTNEKSYYQSYEDFFVPLGIPSKELQQTEWDVEILMDNWFKNGHDGKIVDTKPKLDAENCIILKRK